VTGRLAVLAVVTLVGLGATACDDTPDQLAALREADAAEPPTEIAPAPPAPGRYKLRGDSPYTDLFRAAGERHGVDPAVLEAVARQESGFHPRAVSPAGARGLMQFMPPTARRFGIDPMDPAQAVDGAARYLAELLGEFHRLDLALAGYNAGADAVRHSGGVPPFRETRRYVAAIMAALVVR
jgi:soluble lytic murein transglycosylase-like protein